MALKESKKNTYKTGTKAVSQPPIKQEEIKNPNPSEELEAPDVKSATSQQQEKEKSKALKPKLTDQEIRNRNITWSLSIGVMILLIGGAVLATSTWDVMEDWMKTGMIALFVGSFFALSLAYVTGHLLKVSRTAFAFYVLGALFLPIFFIRACWYLFPAKSILFCRSGDISFKHIPANHFGAPCLVGLSFSRRSCTDFCCQL